MSEDVSSAMSSAVPSTIPATIPEAPPDLLPETIYTCSATNPQGLADLLNSVKSYYGSITIHSIIATEGRIQDTLVKVFIAYYSIPAQQVVIEKSVESRAESKADSSTESKPTVIKKRMYLGQVEE